jgi:pimeloyl-ACP methyl ester carboxylesterase
MTISPRAPANESLQLLGGAVEVLTGGSGPTLIVLHDDIGSPGWLPFHARLAERFTVRIPTLPGWGRSDRPLWARDVRDIAIITHQLLGEMGAGTAAVVGLGFGGWVAAEIATMCETQFSRMVLVAPPGLRPNRGEYLDQFMVGAVEYVRAGFHEQARFDALFGAEPDIDQLEAWEINREMTTRVGWSPYMYNRSLAALLGGVTTPALLVWGEDDRIVPFEVIDQYARALPRARIETLEGAGHYVDIEQPEALAKLVSSFLATA